MVVSRIIKAPEQSFFLLGPRGSGKSTWLRATFLDAHVIDLLSEETYQRLLANPGHYADELRAVPTGRWVIVDEVQSEFENRHGMTLDKFIKSFPDDADITQHEDWVQWSHYEEVNKRLSSPIKKLEQIGE